MIKLALPDFVAEFTAQRDAVRVVALVSPT